MIRIPVTELSQSLNQVQNLFQVILALVPNQSQDMDQGLFQVRELDQSQDMDQGLFQVRELDQFQDMDQGLFQVRELDQSLVLTASLDTTDTDYQSFVNCNYYNEKGLHTLDL